MGNGTLQSDISTCRILGVNIAEVNMQTLVDFIKKNIKELSGKYICVSNVHTTVMAYEDESYRNIQNAAVLSIPDGGPLSSVGRKRGYNRMDRTTGPDLLKEILSVSAENGYKHFFYGSTNETLDKLTKYIEDNYPDVSIAGMYSPPFRELTDKEDEEIVKMINNASPDFIWVGLGAPKQEIWMSKHKDRIKGLMIGVGAAFDYYAGNIKRAPEWMQKANLEWAYRLAQDPKRLLGRYVSTNSKFIWNAVLNGK